jgi:hypothetical protein
VKEERACGSSSGNKGTTSEGAGRLPAPSAAETATLSDAVSLGSNVLRSDLTRDRTICRDIYEGVVAADKDKLWGTWKTPQDFGNHHIIHTAAKVTVSFGRLPRQSKHKFEPSG